MRQRHSLTLAILQERFAICRLDADSATPGWALHGSLTSITRTGDELSIVCPDVNVPDGVSCQRGWRAFKAAGPLDFGLTGVLASLAEPLADAGISIFAIATYDTDYVLVREEFLQSSVTALTGAGHRLVSR